MNFKKKELIDLKNEIKKLASEGRESVKEARATSGKARHFRHLEKRRIGVYARHHLLAYAFLRGMSYNRVEAKCNNKPSEQLVYLVYKITTKFVSCEIDREQITNWFNILQEEKTEGVAA
jgi:hypothetical protein